ncbi:2-aminoadipate transaminase [Clostridium tepidiprofundi DSM 19306]|uniref:2-aminoadipate transaminase n=1 Tax=Clostridium tepidiprofundi DSM 19306 TaxID=1121338 RepID=A0A151B5C6_9CLOT|nr:PLP-dependent aminotransferase family protein [Clostridium tepidiprofundi]KYH35086.1 2-aminoadipate transaminase [Clostridium tepidiprofundi DSM 19306]
MDKYYIDFDFERPLYIQISKHIKCLIEKNDIKEGEKLPSIRKLSSFLDVNKDTIIKAYNKLQTEGFAVQKIGSGTYAKKRDINLKFKNEYSKMFKNLSPDLLKDYIDFTGETACSTYFPVKIFKKVLNEVLDKYGAEAFVYKEGLGFEGLRKSISYCFWDEKLDKDDILIVSGAQQGIDIASKALINVNDNIIVERPTYIGALSVFRWRRANIFEVEIKNDGIDINALEEILKKNRIKCFYTMSYFQNPTGFSYSLEKKIKILELAQKYDFYIIEDDYLSELIYDDKIEYCSFKSLDTNDRVIYIKSFSKIFLPGIRLGYLVSPKKFKENMQKSKINTDISTSSLMQRALDLYINKGLWDEHVNFLNKIYYDKYTYMIKMINHNIKDYVEFYEPGGGFNIYFKILNDDFDSVKLFYECRRRKVLITPGVLFYKNSSDGNKFFRLGFSQLDDNKIEEGIKIIADILKC